MDLSFALANSTSPSHARLFQSVRYIVFFTREKRFQFICFRPRLHRRCRPPSHQSFIAVETHAFVKCDMLHSHMRLFFRFVCFFVFFVLFFFCLVFFSCVSFSRKVSIRQNVKTTIVQNLPEREKEREMSEFDSGDRQQQQRRKTAQLHADSLIPGCQTRSHQAQPEPCEAQTQACALDIALNMIEASREMT